MTRTQTEITRLIRRNWCAVRAYRELTALERRDGREIEARRWIRYRAETLRDIRMLREALS